MMLIRRPLNTLQNTTSIAKNTANYLNDSNLALKTMWTLTIVL